MLDKLTLKSVIYSILEYVRHRSILMAGKKFICITSTFSGGRCFEFTDLLLVAFNYAHLGDQSHRPPSTDLLL